MHLAKIRPVKLIDENISKFQKLLDEATYENVHNDEYKSVYNSTESLLKELFSQEEVNNFRINVTTPIFFDSSTPEEDLQIYKTHIQNCILNLEQYREIKQEENRIMVIFSDLRYFLINKWRQLEGKGRKNPIFLGLILIIIGLVITYFIFQPINTSSPTSNTVSSNIERANLTIKNVSYDIIWRPEYNGNTSEFIMPDEYIVKIRTKVFNNDNSKFDAEIIKTEYYFLNSNNEVREHCISKHEMIPIFPGVFFSKGDNCEIILMPGNYTLSSRIEYKDKQDILTPLIFSASVNISYNNSEIIDNLDWQSR